MSNDILYGATVRITNKFDRLFFEQVGTITRISVRTQKDGALGKNYYIQAQDISCGRWFHRSEFEVIGQQAEVTP